MNDVFAKPSFEDTERFKYYNHLGGRAYYYHDDSRHCFETIENCLKDHGADNLLIDPVAILGILMKNYPIGVRTLVQGVQLNPWLARPNGRGDWELSDLPLHERQRVDTQGIAFELCRLLQDEALSFIGNKKIIGLLLSGGMDSRVLSGVLRYLQETGEFGGDVVAINWGVKDSRDVFYAKEIAKRFKWEYVHLNLDAEVLYNNIYLAARLGAEFSPVHLHALNSVSQLSGLDGILAASYGDSIGRGEYSGRKVCQLPDLLSKHLNHFSFMLANVESKALVTIKDDLENFRRRFPGREEMHYREIEMQMHYMRRQLNSCMAVIDDKVPFYQMFTAPKLYGFIWSLFFDCRTDKIYELILKTLPGSLLSIPWARTGLKYGSSRSKKADRLQKNHNRYGQWLRNDCRDFVINEIRSGSLQTLNVFNNMALEQWCKKWSRSESPRADRLDEKMAWLTSLSLFVRNNKIVGPELFSYSMADSAREYKALLYNIAYRKLLSLKKI